jgi:hypothetical protein
VLCANWTPHADTCCVGKNFQILAYTNRVCDVSAFSNSYEVSKDVPIVLAATKYTDPDFSFSIILVVNQALSFPDVEYSLLNPNQLRYAGLDVWDNPFDTERKLEIVGENENEDQRIVIPYI